MFDNPVNMVVWAFVIPFVLLFSCRMLSLVAEVVSDAMPPVRTNYIKVPVQKIVYRDRPVEKIVYRDRPVEQKKATKTTTSGTDKQVIADVIVGLANMGYSKSDAKKFVAFFANKKKYDCAEDLFRDCLAGM